MRAARRIRHPTWDLSRFSYFSEQRLAIIGHHLSVERLVPHEVPPIYLVCGRRSA